MLRLCSFNEELASKDPKLEMGLSQLAHRGAIDRYSNFCMKPLLRV